MSKVRWFSVVLLVTVLFATTGYAFSFGKYEKVNVTGGMVSIPTSKVDGGKARYFKFSDKGKEIRFFIIKAADGTYRTAFDACDACFREKKGYEQQGNMMVCKNCNMRFATDRIGPHAVGGCNPSHLPSSQKGSQIVIRATDLQDGARYF